MPPKAVKDASVFSLVTAWMKPKAEPPNAEQPKAEHDKTEHSTTPSPTEVADSSQGAENAEKDQTLSPTEVVHSPEYYFEQNAAKENENGSDDDDDFATDEAAAMAELVQEASLANTTLQVLLEIKRPREDPEPTEPAESEAELVKNTSEERKG